MQLESPQPDLRGFPQPLPLLEEVAVMRGCDVATGLAFAFSRTADTERRPRLIVAPRRWIAQHGRPFPPGIDRVGASVLLVLSRNDSDALWAMEQALRSKTAAIVIGAIERATLTQTRRLDFAASAGGSVAILLRSHGDGLSAARRRWRVGAASSTPNLYNARAPGRQRLIAELVRRRDGPPGTWILEQDDVTDRLRLADRLADRGLVEQRWTVVPA